MACQLCCPLLWLLLLPPACQGQHMRCCRSGLAPSLHRRYQQHCSAAQPQGISPAGRLFRLGGAPTPTQAGTACRMSLLARGLSLRYQGRSHDPDGFCLMGDSLPHHCYPRSAPVPAFLTGLKLAVIVCQRQARRGTEGGTAPQDGGRGQM